MYLQLIDKIYKFENQLTQYAFDQMKKNNDMIIYGDFKNQTSIISFNLNGVHFNDLAMLLDKKNIAIRTGHHCAQPFMKFFKIFIPIGDLQTPGIADLAPRPNTHTFILRRLLRPARSAQSFHRQLPKLALSTDFQRSGAPP